MPSPTRRRAAELFKAAIDLEPAARAAFLDEYCRDDAPLRLEMESLLQADGRAERFMATPPPAVDSLAVREPDVLVGQVVGGFRVVRRIASGGMGTVYEATQERLGRTVALKIVRGGWASPAALRRFEYEARMLARLRHPAIAQIYEAGTHAMPGGGLPFFAMEYVPNARTILDFARARRLTTHQRLELFAQVCEAVHYGHQRGVIHRDLKPSNILVGEEGTATALPKIIDFGVARVIDSDPLLTSIHTAASQIVGTLQYMSPEQCGGSGAGRHEVDIRCDVYSLGVVLYELLCERLPYDVSGTHVLEAARIIREQPPTRPSAVQRILRGDLETIVLKALDKDCDRRYQSAGELADDIRRLVNREPISARPPSVIYQLRAFARRHKAMVAGGLAVFIVPIAGIVATSWQAVRASRSEGQARENLRESLIAQARARRQTLAAGRRTDSLDALTRAAAIRPGADLRSEFITTLATPDVRRIRLLPMPEGVESAIVSDDLSYCAGIHADATMSVVRLSDGLEVARVPPPGGPATYLKWHTDARRLIRLFDRDAQPRRVEVWRIPEVATGQPLQPTDMLLQIADVPDRAAFDVSADGRTFAVGRMDHAIHFFDLDTCRETRRIELDRDPSYLRFDPTGRRLARFHARDTDACLMDLESSSTSRTFTGSHIGFALAFSPDGRLVAGADGATIHVWDLVAQKDIAQLTGHETGIVYLVFSHDSRLLASFTWDGTVI